MLSKLGAVLGGVYLVLVVAAVIWANASAQTSPVAGAESALLPVYLTLPFSLVLSVALEAVSAGALGSYLGLLVVVGASAAINAAFLYFVGAAVGRRFSGGGRRT
jgi:hypothetical protein